MASQRRVPSKNQALVYTAVLHYLQAVDAAGTDEAVAANKAMRAAPVDYFGRPATLRQDGRLLYDVTLYRVKKPEESRAPWDYYAPVQTIPARTHSCRSTRPASRSSRSVANVTGRPRYRARGGTGVCAAAWPAADGILETIMLRRALGGEFLPIDDFDQMI